MKKITVIAGLLLVALAIASASAAGTTIVATNPADAAALVYVSGYTVTPTVFYPYEKGTITVSVTNGANASVVMAPPDIIDPHIKLLNENTFNTKTTIGPGATAQYAFDIEMDATDGNYYPLFTISPVVYGNALHSTLSLKVDSSDVRASISQMPDTFSASKKDTVNVSVTNSRDADITNVLVVPEVDGADVFPEETFVGTVAAGKSVEVPFAITPYQATNVTFHVSFSNGDNKHSTETVLPITLGRDKMGAEIVVNNIESSVSGVTTTLKGDVTNNGLTDAKSILVTVSSPAHPTDPNPVYAIGNLAPDDFSSFELSYISMGNQSVPLVVTYKDAQGNSFSETFTIAPNDGGSFPGAGAAGGGAPSGSASSQRRGVFGSFGSGMSQIPVTEIVISLVVIAILIYAWRKGLLRRLTNRFRKDPLPEEHDDDEQKE